MILGSCLKRDLIPDSLQNPVAVMFVVAAFTGAHLLQSESGIQWFTDEVVVKKPG